MLDVPTPQAAACLGISRHNVSSIKLLSHDNALHLRQAISKLLLDDLPPGGAACARSAARASQSERPGRVISSDMAALGGKQCVGTASALGDD
eukprot:6172481-Pleurochrysis_carterae.AAC.2